MPSSTAPNHCGLNPLSPQWFEQGPEPFNRIRVGDSGHVLLGVVYRRVRNVLYPTELRGQI